MTKQYSEWKLSRYTSPIWSASGDLLLHNSFMGAVARVPREHVAALLPLLHDRASNDPDIHGPSQYRLDPLNSQSPRQRSDESDPMLRQLFRAGVLVAADMDEHRVVSEIIERERDAAFGIIVLPHENCNFRCVYCYETFERGKMAAPIATGLKLYVADKVTQIPSLAISWFGGEPLLARDVIYDLSKSFIRDCHTHDVRYSSSITTNGYFLTPSVFRRLLDSEVRHYQITLDGPAESHDELRILAGGGGTYHKIIENLFAMPAADEEFFVRIRVNFNNDNQELMYTLLEQITPALKGDTRFNVDFHPVGKWGGPNDSTLDVCDADSAEDVKLALTRQAQIHGFSDQVIRQSLGPHGAVCYAGKDTSLVIGSDGTVYKCTVAFDDPRNHVGKLRPDGRLDIDKDKWQLWTRLDGKESSKCDLCSFQPSCQSRSCPLVAINQGEPPCPVAADGYVSLIQLSVADEAHSEVVP
jgi:uncharacterized protein